MNNEIPTMNNETLETEIASFWSDRGGWVVSKDFARKLERERDEARKNYAQCQQQLEKVMNDNVYAERDQLREENQTLRNAQKACEDCDAPTIEEVKQLRKVADSYRDWIACSIYECSCERVGGYPFGWEKLEENDREKWRSKADEAVKRMASHKKGQP